MNIVKKLNKKKYSKYSKIFMSVLCAFSIFGGTFSGSSTIKAATVTKVDPNSWTDKTNPLSIYKAQKDKDLYENETVFTAIHEQKAEASTTSSGAEITSTNIDQSAKVLPSNGVMVTRTIAAEKSNRRYAMFYATNKTVVELKNFNAADKISINWGTVGTYKKDKNFAMQVVGARAVISDIDQETSTMTYIW